MKYKGIRVENISIFSTTAVYMSLILLLIKDLYEWVKKMAINRCLIISATFILWLIITKIEALQVTFEKSRLLKTFFTLPHTGLY